MDKNEVCQRIINNLQDDSFPSIVLLSGPWGSGKTYLTRKHLMPKITETLGSKIVPYISLYGVSNIEDFRDRLLANTLTSDNSGNNNLKKKLIDYSSTLKSTVGHIAKFFGDSGATAGVLNALSKPIKHKLLSNINDTVIIVDDLERVSNKGLITDVLGECLYMAENSKNVSFIIIANENKVSDIDILEKTFINRVSIKISEENVIEFINSNYSDLFCDITKAKIVSTINQLNLTNFRVIQRILQRYKHIKTLIENDNSINQDRAKLRLLDHIIRICNAHFVHGYKKEELIQNYVPAIRTERYARKIYIEQNENKNEIKESENDRKNRERLEKMESLLQTYEGIITPSLIEYCLDFSSIPNNFIEDWGVPLKSNSIERINSLDIYSMSSEEFNQSISSAKEFLFKGTNKPLDTWIRTLDAYLYLIEHNFVKDEPKMVLKMAQKTSKRKGIFNTKSILEHHSRHFSYLWSDKTKELYRQLSEDVKKQARFDNIRRIQEHFNSGWGNIDGEIYKNYEHKPLFNDFNLTATIQHIINTWNGYDTIVFGQFMSERYKSTNSYQFLGDEFDFCQGLYDGLKKERNLMSTSLDKGRVTELIGYMEKALECIERSVKHKTSIN